MQYLGFCQQGKQVDYKLNVASLPKFLPEEDGLTFHLNACFTDSLRQEMMGEHAAEKISSGNGFAVRWSRWMIQRLRSVFIGWGCKTILVPHVGHSGLLAELFPAIRTIREPRQQVNLRIPYRLTEGKTLT